MEPAPTLPAPPPEALPSTDAEPLQIEREGDEVRLIINRQALKAEADKSRLPEQAGDDEKENAVAVSEPPAEPAPGVEATEATEPAYRGVADPALLAQWELAFPLPPLPPAEKTGDACFLHTVVRGDTLWDIAARYVGSPWAFRELARNSNIRNPDLIYPGDRIVVILR